MKKTISIILAILFCISIVSCGKKKVEYTFYLGEGAENGNSIMVEGYYDIHDFDFMHASSTFLKLDESEVATVRSFTIDGETWEADYRGTHEYNIKNCAKKNLQKYALEDAYRFETSQEFVLLDFYHETDVLKTFYVSLDSDEDLPETKLSDEQFIEKARDTIVSYYGEGVLAQYDAGEVEYLEISNLYTVTFGRYLHGYKLTTGFYVYMNAEGKVRALGCGDHYKYEEVVNDITKEMIQNAETALRANIPEGLTVQENITKMVMDAHTGKLYLRMYAYEQPTYDENGEKMPTRSNFFYVNIE